MNGEQLEYRIKWLVEYLRQTGTAGAEEILSQEPLRNDDGRVVKYAQWREALKRLAASTAGEVQS